MSLITIPNVFSAGAVIVASQHNSNFSVISSDYNGNIDNTNLAANAAIAFSKVNTTGQIVNADINASAAITDSKLAQITTASKVSGTAITGLASIPSGAGIIPTANLPTLGSLTLISNTTVSTAANTGDIAIINTNYYKINFHLGNLSGADLLGIRFNNDTSSDYGYVYNGRTSSGSLTGGSSSSTSIVLGTSMASNVGDFIDGEITIFPQDGTSIISCIGTIHYRDNAGTLPTLINFSGNCNPVATITSFRILTNGGATMSGNVYLYKYLLS